MLDHFTEDGGRLTMKRDMDLVRQLLLKIEESGSGQLYATCFDNEDPEEVAYHFYLLENAG